MTYFQKNVLWATGIATTAIWVIIALRHQDHQSELVQATKKQAVSAAVADRITQDVTKLVHETAADSLGKLSHVNMFYWPGPPIPSFEVGMISGIPLGVNVGQEDIDAILSNRRTRKIMDELAGVDSATASRIVSNELATAIEEYNPLYDKTVRGVIALLATYTNSAKPINGISFAIDNVQEGKVVILGAKLRVMTLVLVSGMLGLDTKAQVDRVALLAQRHRDDIYGNSTLEPEFKARLLDRASLYNRQIIASALLGLATTNKWESSLLKTDGVRWEERKLTSYRAALTEYDQPVRSGVLKADYSRGSRTIKFLSPLTDAQFDELMRELHLAP